MLQASKKATSYVSKAEATKTRICGCYFELLATCDFDKITVTAVCKHAGIVCSTFYVYFPDIYSVVQLIEDGIIAQLDAVDTESRKHTELNGLRPTTDWGFPIVPPLGFERWFDVCESFGSQIAALLGPHGDPYFDAKIRKQLTRHITAAMEADGMPNDTLRAHFCKAMVNTQMALVTDYLMNPKTTLTRSMVYTILNTMRLGGSVEGEYNTELTRWFSTPDEKNARPWLSATHKELKHLAM